MTTQFTFHIINVLPWSNLNRDDTGLPKRIRQGGAQRGLLSSQSIKRASRVDYENNSLDFSFRSAHLSDKVVTRVFELNPEANEKEVKKIANDRIGKLTKGSASEDEAGRSAWLSAEEIETLAQAIATSQENTPFIIGEKTGSLAIAAFGRMFANQGEFNTEAAIAVSPAVSTHATVIETDYFSTVDDSPSDEQRQGASYLGVANYLNGVFYRTVSIDRAQLQRSWTGIDDPSAREKLISLITSLIYKLPRGKENSTAPYTLPALVLGEAQRYRVAYDFETPVRVGEDGGYLEATVKHLREERARALQFDPDNFGTAKIAGTVNRLDDFGVPVTDRKGIAEAATTWILS